MALVNFTLSAEGVGAFNDALMCIHKFSDDVSLEVKKDKLVLTALNLTKSAYVSFTFAANRFFSQFSFNGSAQYRERFFCVIYIKSLRCKGITATHRISFEAKSPVHAKFDKNEAVHHWTINSRTLRSLMEHFGPGIDLLDINTDGENVVNFTCFTEKVVSVNNEVIAVLKKPLHTSIAVEMDEFDDIAVPEKLHIIISVRDFRAVLQHANWTSNELNAAYSRPGRPMKVSYNGDGIICEFILMTVDEKSTAAQRKGQSKAAAKAARPALDAASASASASSRPASAANIPSRQPSPPQQKAQEQQGQSTRMPPPRRPNPPRSSQFDIRAPLRQPPSTLKSDSLFMPQPDEDDQWEPVNPNDDEDDEHARLEWEPSNEPASTMRISNHLNNVQDAPQDYGGGDALPSALEPTQRLADVRKFGLFSS
ncbi:hypothetical protein M406DRAFT_246528 [Cryphonectria parasitica EP155]|uniref:DNA repair protein rad9 n=1 Tax=Cryphonectria parasitica (strain ATCC 38755 / EP155) TaxID=660469 RepID=A0A9P4YCR8_CRYP1|nr:uncharacterized protein M406DRAFT_246528 [Cryphonectria parasitica EP155]KAF3770265.1 hypothetical protein M406DRAFT_246528 [Cryphonectria parasitica EP155]